MHEVHYTAAAAARHAGAASSATGIPGTGQLITGIQTDQVSGPDSPALSFRPSTGYHNHTFTDEPGEVTGPFAKRTFCSS